MDIKVQTSSKPEGRECRLTVRGRFDFSAHREFRVAYEAVSGVDTYVVDLHDATWIDSSALGMLLLLRDYAGGNRTRVRLVNASPDINHILSIHNFDQLFTVQPSDDTP